MKKRSKQVPPKQPSKVTALAELLRVTEQAGTMNVSRDYFRANSTIGDGWNRYWCSFKAFLAAVICRAKISLLRECSTNEAYQRWRI